MQVAEKGGRPWLIGWLGRASWKEVAWGVRHEFLGEEEGTVGVGAESDWGSLFKGVGASVL